MSRYSMAGKREVAEILPSISQKEDSLLVDHFGLGRGATYAYAPAICLPNQSKYYLQYVSWDHSSYQFLYQSVLNRGRESQELFKQRK